MSTTPEPPPTSKPNEAPSAEAGSLGRLFELLAKAPTDPRDEALDAVQRELVQEKDSRKAERFYWIFGAIIAIDLLVFKDAKSWSGPVVIGILQFVFIISLGRFLGVSDIWTLTERVIEKWSGYFKPGA